MAEFPVAEFVSLVSDFLQNKKSWDDVHRFVIDTEWTNKSASTHSEAVEELRMTFLADSNDDPQFLLSKAEVQSIFDRVHTSSKPS